MSPIATATRAAWRRAVINKHVAGGGGVVGSSFSIADGTAAPTPIGVIRYVSTAATGSGNGTSTGSPWTIAQANTFLGSGGTAVGGDAVLFNRGETFTTALNVARSGTSTNRIIIGAYGAGARPLFNGGGNATNGDPLAAGDGSYIKSGVIRNAADGTVTAAAPNGYPWPIPGSRTPITLAGNWIFAEEFIVEAANFEGLKIQGDDCEARNFETRYNVCGWRTLDGADRAHVHHFETHDNFVMSANTPAQTTAVDGDPWENDDSGAFGGLIHGSDGDIHNFISHGHRHWSYDYDFDGSACELYRGKRNHIHHFISYDDQAGTELGDRATEDTSYDHGIVYTLDPNGGHIGFNVQGADWGAPLRTSIEHCTVYLPNGPTTFVGDGNQGILVGGAKKWNEIAAAVAVGDRIAPSDAKANGRLYEATAISTGIKGATEPTWPTTLGATVSETGSTITWTCRGMQAVLRNNIVHAAFKSGYSGLPVDEDYNIWRGATGQLQIKSINGSSPLTNGSVGPHSQVNVNPLFTSTDPANPAFLRLAPGSPAINAGVDLGFTTDLDGNTRAVGVAPDLGVYEAGGIPPVPTYNELYVDGRVIRTTEDDQVFHGRGLNVFMTNFSWAQADFDSMAAAGYTEIRGFCFWSLIEKSQGVIDPTNLAWVRKAVDFAGKAGLKVRLCLLGNAPKWNDWTRPITGDASIDTITITYTSNNQKLTNGDVVTLSGLSGGAGLNTTTEYFVRDVANPTSTTATFKLALTNGGAAINFTSDITAGSATFAIRYDYIPFWAGAINGPSGSPAAPFNHASQFDTLVTHGEFFIRSMVSEFSPTPHVVGFSMCNEPDTWTGGAGGLVGYDGVRLIQGTNIMLAWAREEDLTNSKLWYVATTTYSGQDPTVYPNVDWELFADWTRVVALEHSYYVPQVDGSGVPLLEGGLPADGFQTGHGSPPDGRGDASGSTSWLDSATTYATAAKPALRRRFRPFKELSRRYNIPWGLEEMGVGKTKATAAVRLQWANDKVDAAELEEASFVDWWDYGSSSDSHAARDLSTGVYRPEALAPTTFTQPAVLQRTWLHDFQKPTSGRITVANAVGRGRDAFQVADTLTDNTRDIDTTVAYKAKSSGRFATGATTGARGTFLGTTTFAGETTINMRAYIYAPADFTSQQNFFRVMAPSAASTRLHLGAVKSGGNRVLQLLNSSGLNVTTFSAASALALATWYRVEATFNLSTGAWSIDLFTPMSETPIEGKSGTAATFAGTAGQYEFGCVSASAANLPGWNLAHIGLSPDGRLGPA
jgi:hypothetical protein